MAFDAAKDGWPMFERQIVVSRLGCLKERSRFAKQKDLAGVCRIKVESEVGIVERQRKY